ncbi:helix-hairpin-helix domain-containing protein [Paenibacillus alvei]|uniref:Helix-hairpin-helix domain-containing protein n=2 Tax=Paenibacillus alvei TaxID=44250 RepID=A0ABT4GU49_PAEAL|nr:helix-hairpin-helix domain-containing protein [Paenibacillus alvei]EJW17302.1 putative competence protein [Paenibacillus alvei DSM 29]MCY9542908.1 helix-hairpin-helix domain-containing protein [Paenibacillus alvei]MCY9735161.1 helix-hairpin-helix domain-containing protein [Paenibacillus alvei]MCY9753364.1 helix-hairpin-helix domain-containing protein [Paenibacillus alvei]MCY9760220.1 helix-hairpin-helix domain-containing protein [Paenibacillus alvei]
MKQGNREAKALPMRWLLAMGLAVIGVAICMWVWVKPQAVLDAGTWTDLNEEIESLIAADGKPALLNDNTMPLKGGKGEDWGYKQQPAIQADVKKNSGIDTGQPDNSGSSETSATSATSATSPPLVAADEQQIKKDIKEQANVSGGKETPSQLININTADISALMTLPGIGPSKAKAIVEYRDKKGAFRRIDDLMKVKGIGKKLMAKIRDKVRIE